MSKLKFLISLMTEDNDYQLEQAKTAKEAAERLGVDCQLIFAGNDAVTQSTQLLKVIHGDPKGLPHAIIFEPVGTGLSHVARAAVSAGVGWVVLNRDVDYVSELRLLASAPVFGVASDQLEVGRIQARQCAALLPSGGTVLYVQGPSENPVAKQRSLGMQEGKTANLHLITLKGQWTEESAIRSVGSWLKLSTSQKVAIDLVVAQNDAMAMGVRKAFQSFLPESDAEHFLEQPFLGVDAVPSTGQAWLRSGLLTATVFTPPNAARAVELLAEAFNFSRLPAERILIPPSSLPALDKLQLRGTSGDPALVSS
jgi:ribose transport system substrate-binding protein